MNVKAWFDDLRDGRQRKAGRRFQDDWSLLVQTYSRRLFRRWVYAALAFFAAVVLGRWAQVDELEALWQTRQEVSDLQQQLMKLPVINQRGAESAPDSQVSAMNHVLDHLPGQTMQARVWPNLAQTLARQHVQLLSMRSVEEPLIAPLPSQAMAVRLKGQFTDWARAWSQMSEGVPVWSLERVLIRPATDTQAVEIDALFRLWMRPGADGPLAWSGQVSSRPLPLRGAAQVFASGQPAQSQNSPPQTLGVSTSAGATRPSANAFSLEPSRWPWAELRLMGILHIGGTRHAILAAGSNWVLASVGQRVSLEGHRLETIGDQAVNLRIGQRPVQVLNFEKASR